jgi:hypothetical protein
MKFTPQVKWMYAAHVRSQVRARQCPAASGQGSPGFAIFYTNILSVTASAASTALGENCFSHADCVRANSGHAEHAVLNRVELLNAGFQAGATTITSEKKIKLIFFILCATALRKCS